LQNRYIPSFYYASFIHVTDHGAAILLNTADDYPETIAWVPNDGDHIQLVEFPVLKNPAIPPLKFRIALEQQTVLFSNSREGVVYRANWPIVN
jgi:hypothetical protein